MAVDNRGDGRLESMPDVGEIAGMLGADTKLEPDGRRTRVGRDREVKLNRRISPLRGFFEIPIRSYRDDRVGVPGVGEFVALELSQRVENVSHERPTFLGTRRMKLVGTPSTPSPDYPQNTPMYVPLVNIDRLKTS